MKTRDLLLIISLFLSVDCFAQGTKQTVVIENLDNKKGKIYIGWYSSAADFKKADKAIFKRTADVDGQGERSLVFDSIPPGTYAIAVFLDENGNGKIDTNFLGIPKEKYGFSNNVYPMMRAASFNESAFTVSDQDKSMSIRLK